MTYGVAGGPAGARLFPLGAEGLKIAPSVHRFHINAESEHGRSDLAPLTSCERPRRSYLKPLEGGITPDRRPVPRPRSLVSVKKWS
jgi:hypothetical protein